MIVHALSLTALSPLSSLEQLMMPFSLDVPLEQLFPISDCSLLILSLHKQGNILSLHEHADSLHEDAVRVY